MPANGIPLDKAELLSVLLEALLYGFSLLMFGGTISVLCSQRRTHQLNRRMTVAACLLLLFSTTHLVIDIIRIMEGLVLDRDTLPGGPNAFFSNVSQWSFVYKNYVYTAQTLVGDGVIIYRCYAVWQSKMIMILPALLWCSVAATGIGAPYTASRVTQVEVFGGSLSQWITAFYASTLTTNLLATILLAYRIWSIDRSAAGLRSHRKSQLRHILHIIMDAGMIYSVTLLAALICFVNQSNGQYVILDMVTPIISITFYMVIIRIGLASGNDRPTTATPLRFTTSGNSLNTERRNGMQVHIMTLTENRIDNDQPWSPTVPMTYTDGRNKRRTEIKLDGVGVAA